MDVTSQYSELTMSHAPNLETGIDHNSPEGKHADFVRIRVQFYMMAVIIPCGLICNTLAFFVFVTSPALRHYTRTCFLVALTVADSFYLVGELLIWLNTTDPYSDEILGLEFLHTNATWCSTAYFLRYWGQFTSSWLIVAVTLERFLSLYYPFRLTHVRSILVMVTIILTIFVISAAVTAFPYWTLTVIDFGDFTMCSFRDKQTTEVWTWVIIRIGSLLLPGLLVFILTARLICKLSELRMMTSCEDINDVAFVQRPRTRSRVEMQHIAMLIIVAVFFLLLRLPYIIMYYLFSFREHIFGDDIDFWFKHKLWLATDITYAIAASNYAVNFFLYCVSSSLFRQRVACCGDKREEEDGGETYMSESVDNDSEGL